MRMRIIRAAAIAVLATANARAQHDASPPGTGAWSPAALRADLGQLRGELTRVQRTFAPAAFAEAITRIGALERAADTLQAAWFELEVARIVALADNGHTSVPPGRRSTRYNRVPVRLAPLGDQFYVLRARDAHADLLGARLVAIDGKPIAQVRDVARTLHGGTPQWRDRNVPVALESPELLHALGQAAARRTAMYRFELANGSIVERQLVGEPADTARPRPPTSALYYPRGVLNEPPGWRGMHDAGAVPWSLQEQSVPFRWREAPEIGAIVIELRQNIGRPGADLGEFLMQMQDLLREKKPNSVVLDMRMNGGGNLNITRSFAQALPTLVAGRVFVLTSPYTFSAAISTVGYLKQTSPERVSIVGEVVGDRLNFWAEGQPITLAQTGLGIGLSTERHDYQTGCDRYPDCHRAVVRNPIRVPTLSPDISAPWTIAAYRAGRDPGMEAIAAALKR